jgi:hypothetical protein
MNSPCYSVVQQVLVRVVILKIIFSISFQQINIHQFNLVSQHRHLQSKHRTLLTEKWIVKEKVSMDQKVENAFCLLMILTCHQNKSMVHNHLLN